MKKERVCSRIHCQVLMLRAHKTRFDEIPAQWRTPTRSNFVNPKELSPKDKVIQLELQVNQVREKNKMLEAQICSLENTIKDLRDISQQYNAETYLSRRRILELEREIQEAEKVKEDNSLNSVLSRIDHVLVEQKIEAQFCDRKSFDDPEEDLSATICENEVLRKKMGELGPLSVLNSSSKLDRDVTSNTRKYGPFPSLSTPFALQPDKPEEELAFALIENKALRVQLNDS